jgi:hypothetical protein
MTKKETIEVMRRDLANLEEAIVKERLFNERNRQAAVHLGTAIQKLCRATTESEKQQT